MDITAKQDFACILMDCDMPIKDGWQATMEIREREAAGISNWIPIIAVTANSMSGDRERCASP